MIVRLIRLVAIAIGTALFLPAIPIVLIAFKENMWIMPMAALNGLLGAWLICAGYYGTWSGSRPRDQSASPSRMPGTS